MKRLIFPVVALCLLPSCYTNKPYSLKDLQESKIKFDLYQLDKDGLAGPEDGKRSITYEFCIPDMMHAREKVMKIDTSIIFTHSPGRSMCTGTQVLCMGNTHQPKAKKKLIRLSKLDFVEKISETYFE